MRLLRRGHWPVGPLLRPQRYMRRTRVRALGARLPSARKRIAGSTRSAAGEPVAVRGLIERIAMYPGDAYSYAFRDQARAMLEHVLGCGESSEGNGNV